MILKDKIVIHIPHMRYENGKYISVDYVGVIKKIRTMALGCGINGGYVQECTGWYKDREYTESLVVMYGDCSSGIEDVAKLVLKDCLQECVAYEYNNELIVIEGKGNTLG